MRPRMHATSGSWGEAERSEMLLLLFVRGLFKFSAAAPPLLVLLKLEPRNGSKKRPTQLLWLFPIEKAACAAISLCLCFLWIQ